MFNLNPWIVIPIYMTSIFISILILQIVDWGKIIRKEHKSTTLARILYFLVALAIGATIGTMFVLIVSIPY